MRNSNRKGKKEEENLVGYHERKDYLNKNEMDKVGEEKERWKDRRMRGRVEERGVERAGRVAAGGLERARTAGGRRRGVGEDRGAYDGKEDGEGRVAGIVRGGGAAAEMGVTGRVGREAARGGRGV